MNSFPEDTAITPTGMGHGITVAVALLLFFLAASSTAIAEEAPRSIHVSGVAERRVAPDMATLSVDIQTQSPDAAKARAKADSITMSALETLREAGVAESDIDSTSLTIRPQYRWVKDENKQEFTAYRVTRSISVRVIELDSLGEMLVALSDRGVNGVQPARLGVADDESLQRELMAEAAINARERADVIANALGESLGELLRLDAHGEQSPMPVAGARMLMAADAMAESSAESYGAGLLTFRAAVSASFGLK